MEVPGGSIKYHSAAAVRGLLDASFPDLADVKADGDRIPGRALAELVARGLERHALRVTGPVNEEPFFVVRCQSGAIDYRILCYLLEPGTEPVWVVECPRTLGRIAKWRGESEEQELGAVVTAIHEALKRDRRVREVRWFPELPAAPFDAPKYGVSPTTG